MGKAISWFVLIGMIFGNWILLHYKKKTRAFFLDETNKKWFFMFIGMMALTSRIVTVSISLWYGAWWQVLTGDMSNFTAMWYIPLIFPKFHKDRYIKVVSSWSVVSAVATLGLANFNFVVSPGSSTASLFGHAFLFIAGSISVFFLPRFDWIDQRNSLIYILSFITYVIIVLGIPYWVTGEDGWGIFSTGLLPPSYREVEINGKIYAIYKSFSHFPMPYPYPTVIFYCSSVLGNAIIITEFGHIQESYWRDSSKGESKVRVKKTESEAK